MSTRRPASRAARSAVKLAIHTTPNESRVAPAPAQARRWRPTWPRAPPGRTPPDRGGPMCRTVQDTAAVLEVIAGADPRDHVTAPAHGKKPVPYRQYANKKSLAGKRLGVVREFMIEASLADRDSIRLANQAIADLKRLGATIVDPVNFDGAIAEVMTSYEPSFFTQTFKDGV